MSLIEVLVGIAIGMIGMLVMFRTISVWDARTRGSTSRNDAQTAGTLAMFNIERDLKLAGMGFGTASTAELGCTVSAYDNTFSNTPAITFAPVVITDGTPTGVPDSIQVLYGNSPFFEEAEAFTNLTTTTLMAANYYNKYGFKRGDVAVMTNGGNTCRLIQITDDTSAGSTVLSYGTGTFSDFYDNNPNEPVRWNATGGAMPTIGAGNLYSLGPTPHLDLWTVNTGNSTLGFTDVLSPVSVTQFYGVAEGVIDMKAEYGYDSNGDGQIADSEWNKTPPADWTKVLAIRVAILVRSRDFAKPATGDSDAAAYYLTTPPSWSGGSFTMKNVDGTTDSNVANSPNNWRYYRYRVYEKVIPLRNMIWGQT